MLDLAAIKRRCQAAVASHNYGHYAADVTALVEEVERLQRELRAARSELRPWYLAEHEPRGCGAKEYDDQWETLIDEYDAATERLVDGG